MRMLLKVNCLLEGEGVTLLPARFEDDERGVIREIIPVKHWK